MLIQEKGEMMDFKNVILVMDLDGTLLSGVGDTSYLRKENEALIKAFIKAGGTFSIATGRSTKNGYKDVKHLPLNFPLHLINGALTLDHNDFKTTIEAHYLDQGFYQDAVSYFNEDKAISVVVINEEGVYDLSHDGVIKSDHGFSYDPVKQEDIPKNDIYKVAFIADKAHCDYLETKLANFSNASDVDFVRSLPRYLETLNQKANKGYAIRASMKRLNLSYKTLVCVGDQMNDETMLKTADLALVPSNADERLKTAYQTLSKSHNDIILEEILDVIKAL